MDILTHRLKLSTAPSIGAPGLFFEFARALPLRVQAAVFTDAAISSLTGLVAVTMMVRVSQEDTASAALMSKTVAAADFGSCTTAQWLARTHQQLTFEFTGAECNLTLDGSKTKFWLVFKGLLDDGSELLLGSGWAACVESNATAAGDPPDNPEPGISGPAAAALVAATQIDLRVNDTHVQWKRASQETWTNLIALAELTGAPGNDGNNGTNGLNPELQVSGDWLQWRLVGAGSWTNLFDLSTLAGDSGLVETVPAVAQHTELNFAGANPAGLLNNYVDIPFDAAGHVLRVWFDDAAFPGSPPATPPGGRIASVPMNGGETDADLAAAFAAVVNADADLVCSAAGTVAAVTQPAGALDAITQTTALTMTVITVGADAYDRFLAISGELITGVDAALLNGFQASDFAGAVHTHSYLTGLTRRPQCKSLANDFVSTSSSLASLTGLGVAVEAGVSYHFDFHGFYSTSASVEDAGFAMLGPASNGIVVQSEVVTASTGTTSVARNTSWDSTHQTNAATARSNLPFRIAGTFTPTASGTLYPRLKTELSSGGQSSTIHAGAALHVTPVD